jgi:hypothetical protein
MADRLESVQRLREEKERLQERLVVLKVQSSACEAKRETTHGVTASSERLKSMKINDREHLRQERQAWRDKLAMPIEDVLGHGYEMAIQFAREFASDYELIRWILLKPGRWRVMIQSLAAILAALEDGRKKSVDDDTSVRVIYNRDGR